MKQEDTRQKILDKALELFAAKGYDSVSVGEIAQAVGIKAPSLYNTFRASRPFSTRSSRQRRRSMRRTPTDRHPCAGCGAGHSCFYGDHGGRPV